MCFIPKNCYEEWRLIFKNNGSALVAGNCEKLVKNCSIVIAIDCNEL
jgi:hypothetical protein